MRVFGYPAWSNASRNPYNALLSLHLARLGWDVSELTLFRAIRSRADVIHIHWPQAVLNEPFHRALRRALLLLFMLLAQRLQGAQVVWTVHNVVSHEGRHPKAERLYMNCVLRLVSGLIVLNGHSRGALLDVYPQAQRLPWAQIPHGLYGESYPGPLSKLEARSRFGLDQNDLVVGLVGDLKGYKGIDRLFRALRTMPAGAVTTFIAGAFSDCDLASQVRAASYDAATRGHKVQLREGYLAAGDLTAAIAASDLLILPYSSQSNSGLAILAAEKGASMLLPASGPLRDLAEEVGPAIARTSSHFSGRDILVAAQSAHDRGAVTPPARFLQERSQVATASLTSDFFLKLIEQAHVEQQQPAHEAAGTPAIETAIPVPAALPCSEMV